MNAPPQGPTERTRAFRFFLAGGALWFAGMGLQQVLIPYLVTVTLAESAARVGLAMMTLQLPALLLALPAGARADRSDPRRQLLVATALAGIAPAVFAAVLFGDQLSYGAIIAFGVVMGALSAFTMTARDTMLAAIADPAAMQRAVGAFTISTFGAQLIGMGLAAAAHYTGPAPLFVVEAVLLALSAAVLLRTHPVPPRRAAEAAHGGGMRKGLAFAWGHGGLRAVLIAMLAIGVFYVGSYIVLVPLLTRDVHHGDAVAFALVNVCFWGGTVASNLVLMRRPVAARGKALIASTSSGACILALMSLDAPFAVYCLLITVWGMGAGVSMNMGRTMIQEGTPPALRGRMLALFQLGFIGGAPIGAIGLGLIAEALGPQNAILVAAASAAVAIGLITTLSGLRHITRAHPDM